MYEPEVDDYVIWDQGEYGKHEGWVYFKGEKEEPKKGFPHNPRYITIEIGVKPKPHCQYTKRNDPHKMIHTLLLCYEQAWHELKYVKSRKHAKNSVDRDNIDYEEYIKTHSSYDSYHSQEYRYEDVQ
tara:strand:- start:409 stop:789 length:381 start_codon:yes stop_codon:yes gene_type:complete